MQVRKIYSGALEDVTETVTRPYSFGMTATMQLNAAKTDFINQTIADFLSQDCGVDAAYEDRGSSGQKWLWIFGCPFLFTDPASTSNHKVGIYGPFSTTSLTENISSFEIFSSKNYSAVFQFAGNPSTGFSLFAYGYNDRQLNYGFKVVKATNILNGRNALFYALGDQQTYSTSSSSQPAPPVMVAGASCVDFDETGAPDKASIGVDMPYMPYIDTTAGMYSANSGKIPLVPIRVNLWELTGCYCYPRNWGVPVPFNAATQLQAEFEIGGRRFISTTPNSGSLSNYINLGLIEVTETEQGA